MREVTLIIRGSQQTPLNEADPNGEGYELITDGEYSCEGGIIAISYVESELMGFPQDVRTTFRVEGDTVTLSRSGGFSGDMVFCQGKKHYFVYDTPYGSMTMGVETYSLSSELDESGGELNIDYAVDVENIIISKNIFKISVK
ncbi:MAG: DUF1934 domain-containing protein [Oscillospiraceae bacterium]|nr:DUF1934 domain-containing protein [Oscillospiraceae bacterium]